MKPARADIFPMKGQMNPNSLLQRRFFDQYFI
jgi:hypothetical protein